MSQFYRVLPSSVCVYKIGCLHLTSLTVPCLLFQNYVKKEELHSSPTVSTLGIAVGCIAVFVIIVIGIVVLRKKASRVPVSHGFVEVDQAASPEERHVANMQINGYENPTYKYFEMNGNSA